jgi:hypothetical protein
MDYEQYVRDSRSQYAAFAETVSKIIEAAVGDRPTTFRLQQIKHREKSPGSLHRKLAERGLLA